ncbi:serine/threonine-protein kinase [Marinactinospora rubrisoli]|uniref:Serine/threonine-protein kinase n=1 Tax=Marinactinospora rubrisoli TaxID=2715399 RepID=A0ABW2KHK0_9ACTN
MTAESGSLDRSGDLPPELRPLRDGDPARIGPYRVVGRLGEGGMGTVFGALDAGDRCIAVKVIHRRFAADPRFRARFAEEAELMRRVGGLCTAAVHACDTEAEQPWLATDFVPGPTLRRHVQENGPLTGAMLLAFAAGTAEALQAVHAAGVVHCDLKPANVILSPDGPKVLDFGIAHPASAVPQDEVFGSPGWISPERLAGAPGRPSADMFAWGGMVAFAATGRAPFGSGTGAEPLRRTREETPDLDGVPAGLLPLVTRALAKDPAERPTAEAAFHAVLELAEPETAAGADAATDPRTDPGQRLRDLLAHRWTGIDVSWHRPARWVAAAAAVGAVAAQSGAGALGGAAATGATTAAGSAGIGTTGAAAAGGGLAGGGLAKGLAIAAAAVVTAGAVATGGYFAAGALAARDGNGTEPSPGPTSPQETVAHAVDLALAADGFEITEVARLTAEAATAQAPPGIAAADYIALTEVTWRYRYDATAAEPTFETLVTGDEFGDHYVRVGDDVMYRDEFLQSAWQRNPGQVGGVPVDPDDHTPEAALAGLRAIAESGDVTAHGAARQDGVAATRYSGTFALTEVVDPGSGEEGETQAPFELWLTEEGFPLRLEYTGSDTEHVVDYLGFGPIEIDAPGLGAAPAGDCGTATTPDGRVVEVDSQARELPCDEAVGIVNAYFNGDAVSPPGGGGSGGFATVNGEWTCGWASVGAIETMAPGERIGGCTFDADPSRGGIAFLKTG